MSCASVPSLVTTRISRISSARLASTLMIARVVGVGRGGRALEERALVDARHVERHAFELVAARQRRSDSRLDRRRRSPAARDLRGGLGGALHRVPVESLDVGVAGRVALLDAHAEAHRHAARGALEDPLVEDEPAGGAVLEEEIGVVAAAAERDGEQLAGERRVDGAAPAGREGGAIQMPIACFA